MNSVYRGNVYTLFLNGEQKLVIDSQRYFGVPGTECLVVQQERLWGHVAGCAGIVLRFAQKCQELVSDPNVMFGQGHDLRLVEDNLVGVHLAKDQARLSDLVFIPFLEHFGCPGEDPSNLQSQNDWLRPWHGLSEIFKSSSKVMGLNIGGKNP